MSKLIVVCGLGGSGKTTTAKELPKQLNIACLHKDKIKSAVHDVLDLLTPKALNLLLKFTEDQISNGVDLIIEGPFNFEEDAEIFEKWQEKFKINLFFAICSANNHTRKERILSRERHACHQEADEKLLSQIETKSFDYSIMPGKHINVVINKPTEEIVKDITKQIFFN